MVKEGCQDFLSSAVLRVCDAKGLERRTICYALVAKARVGSGMITIPYIVLNKRIRLHLYHWQSVRIYGRGESPLNSGCYLSKTRLGRIKTGGSKDSKAGNIRESTAIKLPN